MAVGRLLLPCDLTVILEKDIYILLRDKAKLLHCAVKHLEKEFQEDALLYFSSSLDKNELLNHDDLMRSWRVEVSITHVMFPVSDDQIHGLVASVVFHFMTHLIISSFPLYQGLKCLS